MMVTERTQRSRATAGARCAGWFLLVLLVVPALALAQSIPGNLRAAILLRALEYEKVFASSKDPALLIVLTGSGGARDGTEMTAALKQLAQAGAGSRRVVVDEVKGDSNAADLMKRAPAVLYVADGNESA